MSVGNATQPFLRLLDTVAANLQNLPGPVFVQYGYTAFSMTGCVCEPFISMQRFETLVCRAQILIMHAGAGSIIHGVKAGKVPIVMPRLRRYKEHVDDHQVDLAEALAREKRVVIATDKSDLMAAVHEAIALQALDQKSTVNRLAAAIASSLARTGILDRNGQ